MSEAYIGEIRMLPYTFAPRSWAWCNGQLMPIAENTALFSILGTTYGGDGRTTFGLPNLQGRIPLSTGRGPGLTPHLLGQMGGAPTATLTQDELPNHTHEVIAAKGRGGATNSPDGAYIGGDSGGNIYMENPTSFVNMASQQLQTAGEGEPHPNIQPFTVVNYCICLVGEYPSRN